MSANQWGHIFKFLSFGESHGAAVGAVIEGCPAGVKIDLQRLKRWMQRRRPGQSSLVSSRNEPDEVEVLSGIFEDTTLGTPICLVVRNQDQRSEDYRAIKTQPRAGHADDVWQKKFGHYDYRGGGRSSGRETLARVLAGFIAEALVKQKYPELKVLGFSKQIGPFEVSEEAMVEFLSQTASDFAADQFQVRFPEKSKQAEIEKLLTEAKEKGLSYGGQAEIVIENTPQGWGQPVFRKLKSDFAQAALSLGASMAFELGEGIEVKDAEGSHFHKKSDSKVYGGVRGGISTGEKISYRVSFKPTSSVLDVAKKGRHDPCIVPRAVPVLEAMTWIILADHMLWSRLDRV